MPFVRPGGDPEELRRRIFAAVQEMYTEVAEQSGKQFHFPTGRRACELVGYQKEDLDSVPAGALESFAGTGCPFIANIIQPGQTVLDVGCGSGTDTLLAAGKVGERGAVIGIDMTPAMRQKAEQNRRDIHARNVRILGCNAEQLQVGDGTVDVITSNGVLNLLPDKPKAFSELYRVLKPGGKIQIADIVLEKDISASARQNPSLWAECVVGAVSERLYVRMFRDARFQNIRVIHRFDYFAASQNKATREVAKQYGASSIVLTAHKPQVSQKQGSAGR